MENKLHYKKGFTLVEVIIVLVIIAILAAITIPSYLKYVDKSRSASDLAYLRSLNHASIMYKAENQIETADTFEGFNTDQARMEELLNENLIEKIYVPKQNGAEYNWNISNQTWVYNDGSGTSILNPNSYVFSNMASDDPLFDIYHGNSDSWIVNDEGLFVTGNYSDCLFYENPNSEYTLSTDFRLNESSTNRGGLGIFFETGVNTESDNIDTGYILQFDRGYSEIIIRKRVSGSENYPILTRIGNKSTSTVLNENIPDRNDDWWEQDHNLSLNVIEGDTDKKEVSISLDGQTILENFEVDSSIDASDNHTGFRAWQNESATVYEMNVE